MAQQQMSLFSPSLAQAQAGLMQEDEAITSKLAQLTPEQQLTRVALQGGRQAGRALGGLFGIEDPRLKEAAQQEAIFKELKDSGVDFKDPEKLYSALSDAYQARGMIDKAIVTAAKLEDIKATKLKSEAEIGLKGAQTTKALAEAAKAQREQISSPFGKVDPDKFTPESLNKFQQTGNYQDLVPVEPTKFSDPYPMPGADGKQILVQKNLRTGQIEPVDKASRVSVSASANTALPKNLKAIGEVRQDFLRTIDPYVKAYNTASTSETMFDQALQGNFQGWRAAITQLAKSVGDSQISAREIEAYGLDPSLVGSIVDKANVLLTGTPSRDTILGAKKIATAIKDINQQRSRKEQEVYLDLATKAEGYTPESRRYFDLPMLAPGTDTGTNQKTTSRGTRYTVE